MRACIKSLPSDIIVMISDDSRLNLMFLNDLWCKWCTMCMARLLRTYVFSHSFKWNQIDCISGEVFSSFLVLHTKNEEKPRRYLYVFRMSSWVWPKWIRPIRSFRFISEQNMTENLRNAANVARWIWIWFRMVEFWLHTCLLKSKESMSDVVSTLHSPLKMEQLCNKNVCKNENYRHKSISLKRILKSMILAMSHLLRILSTACTHNIRFFWL